jgi:hypothetical protein
MSLRQRAIRSVAAGSSVFGESVAPSDVGFGVPLLKVGHVPKVVQRLDFDGALFSQASVRDWELSCVMRHV